MIYPLITFVATAHNERTLVLTFPTKEDAWGWYDQLSTHNFCWYVNTEKQVVVSIKLKDGSFLNVKLLQPIELYKNYIWFVENRLAHITTDFQNSRIEDKILPTALNQQIPCP
jgi:hypothetical protein